MSITVRQLHPLFAGQVTGVDLREPLDNATIAAIDAAISRLVLCVIDSAADFRIDGTATKESIHGRGRDRGKEVHSAAER